MENTTRVPWMDRPLGLPLPNHLLNPGIGSAVKKSREQWVRKMEGKVWESGGQRSEKRRAKVRKAESKSQESGGQWSGKWRAKVRKVEGKGQKSRGQRSGKWRAKQRETFCLPLQCCAHGYCAKTTVLCCHAGNGNRTSWRLCTTYTPSCHNQQIILSSSALSTGL